MALAHKLSTQTHLFTITRRPSKPEGIGIPEMYRTAPHDFVPPSPTVPFWRHAVTAGRHGIGFWHEEPHSFIRLCCFFSNFSQLLSLKHTRGFMTFKYEISELDMYSLSTVRVGVGVDMTCA